jgi:hypothetical protein
MERNVLFCHRDSWVLKRESVSGPFIRHIKRSIRMIETKAGGDLSKRDDWEIIEPDEDLSSSLMTLNF